MKRRSILMGLGLGVGGAAAPLWLARSFGVDEAGAGICDGEPDDVDVDVVEVEQSAIEVEPASAQGPLCERPAAADGAPCTARPQLILVIPSDQGERYFRGRAFGELLNYGDDLALARLALFDVVCATIDEVRALTSKAIDGEPWMVMVDRTREPAAVVPLDDAELRGESDDGGGRYAPGAAERDEAAIDRRLERLSAMISAAIEPATLARLTAAESASLSPRLRDELDAVITDAIPPRLALAEAATATLLDKALAGGDPSYLGERWRETFLPRLAEVTRERLVRSQPPAGARWAYSGGCGTTVEGSKERVAFGCGMGHVPARSRRFLSWLSDHERGF